MCGTIQNNSVSNVDGMPAKAERRYQDGKVTSIALSLIALFFGSLGLALFAIGTMPSTMTIGMGIIPAFVGAHCLYIAFTLVLASLVMLAVTACRRPAHQLP